MVGRAAGAWLNDSERQGKTWLPLEVATVEGGPYQADEVELEDDGRALWPSDFSDDSIDVYTNFLCYGSGNESQPCLTTYCYLNVRQLKSKNMMSLESLDQILGWANSEPGYIKTVSLLGGEFALHPHAKEIIRRVWAAGFNLRIVTNGSEQFRALLDDDEVVDMLRDETRNNMVAVSLDSIVEEENDKNRGPGAAKKALATIEALNRSGREIPFRINATPLLNCVDGLYDLYKGAEELGARAVLVHYPDAVGRGRSLIPGPQSQKALQQPGPAHWERVRMIADVYNRHFRRRHDFKVRCERGFDEVTHCPLVERSSSLHFTPQISDGEGIFSPVVGCAFDMESAETTSAYVMRDGILTERKGPSQLKTARRLLEKPHSVRCTMDAAAFM